MMCRRSVKILRTFGRAISPRGRRAIPDGDHRSINVVHATSPTTSLHWSVVLEMNRMKRAIVRGMRLELTMNPTVPYLRAHRYQKRLELMARRAAIAATGFSASHFRAAR